jgi:hypothetical protein
MDLFETMENCRAMAAAEARSGAGLDLVAQMSCRRDTCAPVGGNVRQKWRFLVIKDPKRSKQAGRRSCTRRPTTRSSASRYQHGRAAARRQPGEVQAPARAVEYLTDHFAEAPVWIVACLEDGANPAAPAPRSIRRCRTWCWPAARSGSARR